MHYLHQWSCREQVKVHVESQNSQGDRWDVVQTDLKNLGGQEQQSQVGSPLSVPHTENSLTRNNCENIYSGKNQERERVVVLSDPPEEPQILEQGFLSEEQPLTKHQRKQNF